MFSPLLAHVSRLQTDFPQAPVRRGAGYLVVVSRWSVTSGGKQPATWTAGHTVCFMLPLHYSSDGNVVFRHHLLFKKSKRKSLRRRRGRKVVGFNLSLRGLGPFAVEFACSCYAQVSFLWALWVPPPVQKPAHWDKCDCTLGMDVGSQKQSHV